MTTQHSLMLAVFVLSVATLFVFCRTKKEGFGPYNTSTLLLIMALSMLGLLGAYGTLDNEKVANILFAVVGFAGGLFTGGKCNHPKS